MILKTALCLLLCTFLPPGCIAESPVVFDEDLIRQPYFLDKSDIFYTLMVEYPKHPAFVHVTVPPRFGKTAVLQMIRTFLEMELDENDQPRHWLKTKAFKMFKRMKVSRYKTMFYHRMARYPVIYLDLKFTIEGALTEANVVAALNAPIRECYLKYRRFIEKASQQKHLYNLSDFPLMEKALLGTMDRYEIMDSLKSLADFLYEYFKINRAVLLVDDYDYCVDNIMRTSRGRGSKLIKLLNEALSRIIESGYGCINYAFLVGLSSMIYSDSIDQFYHVRHYAFVDYTRFIQYFGVTDAELYELFDRYDCDEHEQNLVLDWYDGYKGKDMYNITIYSMESITQYFIHRKPNNYWVQAHDSNLLYQFLRVPDFRIELVHLLIQPYTTCVFQYPRILHFDIKRFPSSGKYHDVTTPLREVVRQYFVYFYEMGYMCFGPCKDHFKIPNYEIRRHLINVLTQFYTKRALPMDQLRDHLIHTLLTSAKEDEQTINDKLRPALRYTSKKLGKPQYESFVLRDYAVSSVKGLEYFCVLYAVALSISSSMPGAQLVTRENGQFIEHDDIVIYHQDRALIIRIYHVDDGPLKKSLFPIANKNVTRFKFMQICLCAGSQVNVTIETQRNYTGDWRMANIHSESYDYWNDEV